MHHGYFAAFLASAVRSVICPKASFVSVLLDMLTTLIAALISAAFLHFGGAQEATPRDQTKFTQDASDQTQAKPDSTAQPSKATRETE
ncbi:hypothetical protein AEAC466_13145 [Asticcacaulis sp. AC466]|uniref:hypothetical protein n=1 Tax=Asticcacaulis sp. AC466 TaxID=1282362 RepID=UPI0003C408AC|nr:hypothetical protein [Asticcacaulis sp. AC466]ESQ83615.1 hypothetical protein AEAC466_13145 [Asticcacaulis sp. AC466]